jgi:extracellular factor (EF) 3-hydroxypalmitic acid methyl ester biosynthesis protein
LALIEQLREGFVPMFVDYTTRIDAALRGTPKGHADALKSFSRALLHGYFMQSPLMHRCLTKPLGYPGDYVVMRYLYEDHFEGSSLLAKAIHLGGVSTPACDAVRARKDMIFDTICETVAERARRGKRTRIISIAAGPAQETVEIIRKRPELAATMDVLLFDQDHDALEYVNNRVALARAKGAGKGMTIQLRHDTIRRLLDDPEIFAEFGKANLVFSSGLFDYLRFRTGVRLIRNLYSNLAQDGSLYVGNIVPEQPTRWIFDHHLEWFLEYRSRDELLTMGEDAVSAGQASIIEEASGHNPFVRLTRS